MVDGLLDAPGNGTTSLIEFPPADYTPVVSDGRRLDLIGLDPTKP